MHGLTRELYGRTIRGVKGAGGGVGEKKKLFTWKIVREKKMHKAKQAGKHEPAHMKKKKKKDLHAEAETSPAPSLLRRWQERRGVKTYHCKSDKEKLIHAHWKIR